MAIRAPKWEDLRNARGVMIRFTMVYPIMRYLINRFVYDPLILLLSIYEMGRKSQLVLHMSSRGCTPSYPFASVDPLTKPGLVLDLFFCGTIYGKGCWLYDWGMMKLRSSSNQTRLGKNHQQELLRSSQPATKNDGYPYVAMLVGKNNPISTDRTGVSLSQKWWNVPFTHQLPSSNPT